MSKKKSFLMELLEDKDTLDLPCKIKIRKFILKNEK
jgi:hypothetical protein